MITRFINIRFLLALASLQVAVMASADAYNYFYIDHQVLNQGNLGEEITIPVKAFFETPVTSWDVRFVFPEGITPVSIERGSEMTFDYDNGHQIYFSIAQNNDLTHFAASTYGTHEYLYDEDDEYQLGDRLQWESGYHEDMFYLTVRISPDFMDGHIQIISNTTYGYENDPESGIAIDPSVVNYVLEADVNQDGTISVSDVTNILCIITEGSGRSNGYREDGPIYALGDINHDGSIDITDAEELCDYLVFGEWYIGYELNQATYAAHYSMVWNNPSYINFFIDPLIITEKDLGQDIVVPVKATFESIISSWDVEFSFPEGLTPVAFTQGKDMSHEYYDEDGCINTITDNWLAHNTALTHFVVHSPFCDHYIMDENDYWWYSQVIKWEPGTYDEMFLLTLHVDESFVEGPIVINSKASFGYDPRDGSLYPTTVVYNEYDVYPGDANHDGSVTVADITYFLNYIAGAQDDAYGLSDAHPDNVIDILDVEKTFDYIIYGEWYEGYVLNQSEGTEILAKFIEQGDANGDGQTTIGDVVTIIDYLLDGNGEILSTADVNGDGFVTIGDVTALIDMLLSSN